MRQKTNEPPDISDKEIIKKILSEKDDDALIKEELYRMLYEASSADEESMDTDLLDECVKAINLIEGDEGHLPEEKLKAMRQNVERDYYKWHSSQRRRSTRKRIIQVAAALILFFLMLSAVADALGHNLIQSMINWGKAIFRAIIILFITLAAVASR